MFHFMIRSVLALLGFSSITALSLNAAPLSLPNTLAPTFAILAYPVPDGGTTVALLGVSLLGLLLLRKKFSRK